MIKTGALSLVALSLVASMAYARDLAGPKQTWVDESAMIWNAWEWARKPGARP
jgi:hypothetical protein